VSDDGSWQKLLDVLRSGRTVFEKVEIVGPGTAYHYSPHGAALVASGRFLGASVNEDIDRTQQSSVESPPATDPQGVVFAYEDEADAREEGFGCEIFRIDYRRAVKAVHSQEDALLAAAASRTVLIVAGDIERFESIGVGDPY